MNGVKLRITPPSLQVCGGSAWMLKDETPFTTAAAVVDEVAGAFRYRRSIRKQVQTDLLRFCALEAQAVHVGITELGRPFFYMPVAAAERWLKAGGRAWIIAELGARSDDRVVPFPGRRA